MKKIYLILILLLSIACFSCNQPVWIGDDKIVVTSVEKSDDLAKGDYYVNGKKEHGFMDYVEFYTDSVYCPGDTLKIGRK